ncbi:MAG: hypothetical protein SWY16_21700 [Cyanobacteriota bacterium]|nr:hypothetical protein [Cyanobacteriota bacterium]
MNDRIQGAIVAIVPKVKKQLSSLPKKTQKQYRKAFSILSQQGPSYRSLRTHRYQQRNGQIWGSSASMRLRFYWDYAGRRIIKIVAIDSH